MGQYLDMSSSDGTRVWVKRCLIHEIKCYKNKKETEEEYY